MQQLSVVIPTYQRPVALVNCLRCLEKQTLEKELFEVIVISDGYDPVTQNAMDIFLKRTSLDLKFLFTEANNGPASARNLGWRMANGCVIAFTDDDCQPASHWLAAYYKYYLNHGTGSDAEPVALSGLTSVPFQRPQSQETVVTDFVLNLQQLETASFITANCACMKRDLELVGGFDERYKMAWREDSDLEFAFRRAGVRICVLAAALVVHPIRKVKWGISVKEQKKSQYNALLYKKYPTLYREEIQSVAPFWYYFYIIFLFCFLLFLFIQADLGLTVGAGALMALCFGHIFLRRWSPLPKKWRNTSEMLWTSLIIPFYSIYWRLYGAWKFKIWFF